MPVNAVSEACENTPMANPDRFLLAGVMGWPVMHSRSPLLHNYWFKQHGLAGTYVPLAIAPATLAAALRALHPLGFAGCNLTLPHKQAAMAVVEGGETPEGVMRIDIGSQDRLIASAVSILPAQLLAWRLAVERGRPPGSYIRASKVTTRE